ncbi:GNAT family N-acetyltransferase [Trinickia violacea]|uniref:Acyl-homoserine-lactone synthase n=1 Tax=Trinickia violacea TaxID=2571746 RepID=A0A4P8IWM6_9BURK|nr:acyl-homoserine-lactone synthase [Trinickia violacea]QCP53758.1 GNAT family N-acetyltransferase [Trinickia violacea]
MKARIRIGTRQDFEMGELAQMYRLRAKVFRDRMKWDVAILSGMEIDGYDALSPHYMLVHGSSNELRGCWRVLPTEGPYMLKDTFPELLHGRPIPEDPRIWELSRFAIESDAGERFAFGDLALDAMREIVNFADRMGIVSYVTVTTTSVERLLKRTGIDMSRFGPPMRIGVENAVALTIEMNEQTHHALFGQVAKAA